MATAGADWSLLKDATTFIPIVHLLAACFFIYGYCSGFGSRIIAFVTISDVFIVSVRAVGQVYILISLPILVAFSIRFAKQRDHGKMWSALITVLIMAGMIAFVLSASLTPLSGRRQAEIVGLLLILVVIVVYFALVVYVTNFRKVGAFGAQHVAGMILAIFVLSSCLGYSKGVTDRARQYGAAHAHYFQCPDGRAIIRPIGSHYLSLDPGNQWGLVDGDCVLKFILRD